MNTKPFAIALTLALTGAVTLVPSCVPPPRTPGHVSVGVGGVSFGVYDRLPPGYNSPYYYYGNRYYWGGRWETGRFVYRGRHYDGRYFHNGRYIYGGRFHGGPAGHAGHRHR